MKQFFLTATCLFSILFAQTALVAQQTPLSVEESVTGAWSTYAPDRLSGLQWVKGSDGWSYTENDTLKVMSGNGKLKFALALDQLNRMAETSMKRFPQPTWLDAGTFRFRTGSAWYVCDFRTKQAKKVFDVTEGANFTFSDDGQHLAYTVDNNVFIALDNQQRQVTDHPEGIVAGQGIARFEFGISGGLFWSPNGSALAFYEKDERHVSDYPLIDYTKQPAQASPIKYPMAGEHSEYAALGVYHISKGSAVYLNVNDGVKDDSYYITNVAWNPDGEHLIAAIISRDQRTMQLIEFDARTGNPTQVLFSETAERYVEPQHPPIFIPENKGRFLWFSERDGFNNLYFYSAQGKLAGKTSLEFPITEFLGFGPKASYAVVAAQGTVPTERHIFKVNLPTMRVEPVTRSSGVHRAQLSPDGSRIIDEWSGPETPLRSEILQLNGKIERVLKVAENPLTEKLIGETKIGSLKASDGTDLYYRMITPPNRESGKRYPALVYAYNGPHVQLVTNSWLGGAPLWMHALAAQGYVVFTLDGRGSNNRGRDFEQIIHRQMGEQEMADQLLGASFIKRLPFVDPERVAIHGWSYGGFMATSLMLRHPGVFKLGIAGGPVIDWSMYEVMYTERYMDTPTDNPEGFAKNKLTTHADQLEGRLLLIHGADDDVVVLQHSMAMLKAFVDAGKDVDFFVYPGHKHNVGGKDRVHLIQKIMNYLNDHL